MRRNARVDSNQKEIVEKMRSMGCAVIHTYQLKEAFDLLVGFQGELYVVEVKKDEKSKLTPGENKC